MRALKLGDCEAAHGLGCSLWLGAQGTKSSTGLRHKRGRWVSRTLSERHATQACRQWWPAMCPKTCWLPQSTCLATCQLYVPAARPAPWLAAGDNRIIIHGGANTAPWQLGADARAAIASAGAVLLQREIPEAVNVEVAQVGEPARGGWGTGPKREGRCSKAPLQAAPGQASS